jgi:DNA-binding MarR family transcriptional regulator
MTETPRMTADRFIQSARQLRTEAKKHGLKFDHAVLLLFTSVNNGKIIKDLLKVVGCLPAQMTRLLCKLDDMGLIMRIMSKDDRREIIVRTTTTGKNLCNKLTEAINR